MESNGSGDRDRFVTYYKRVTLESDRFGGGPVRDSDGEP